MSTPDRPSVLYISLIDVSVRGGSTEHVIGIAAGLARLGHRVTLVSPVRGSPDPRLEAAGVTIRSSGPAGSAVGAAFALRRTVRAVLATERFDVIYLRAFPADWPILVSAIPTHIPFAYELNTILDNEYVSLGKPRRAPVYRWLAGHTLRRAAGWMPVTPEIGEWAEATSGVERPIRIALNGIAPIPVEALDQRAATRQTHTVGPDDVILAMAGFSYPWHGVEVGLDAVAALPPRFRLWLIGSGSDEQTRQTRALAEARGVQDRVRIFGRLSHDEVTTLLTASDIGLGSMAFERIPMREGQEMKVAHSLAAGLPIVINHPDPRIRSALPFVRQVAPKDPLALAAGITDLAGHLAPELRLAAHRFASSRLTWAAAAADTAEFLQSFLDRTARG